jgi:hypothetical protein
VTEDLVPEPPDEEEEPNERQAELDFEAAMQKYMEILGQREGLLVEWFLITAEHVETGDGRAATVNGIYGPYNQRVFSAAGLLRYATVLIDERIRDFEDDG